MKPTKMLLISAIALLLFSTVAFVAQMPTRNITPKPTAAGDGFAVLELFTSEGCSSCPAADDLLGRIQEESTDKPVYVLAYHVDYWDRMGWKDAFSSPKFSDRQYKYSQWLGSQVYTPQLVVNGKQEFIGSDKPNIGTAVDGALKGTAKISFDLQARLHANTINVAYRITGKIPKSKLLVAVVQKHVASKVGNGENKGRMLNHWQIVRKLYTLEIDASGKNANPLPLPDGFNTAGWEIIGMLQNQETGVISAASRASLELVP